MQLPGSQSPDTVRQSQTIVTILHPTQVLMFYGVIDRKAITLQEFSTGKDGTRVTLKLGHTHFAQTHEQKAQKSISVQR